MIQQKLELLNRFLKKYNIELIYIYIFCYFLFLLVLMSFRSASGDETYYLKEALLISELFKKGIWIGDYGVGLHGFLFKIPVAILFIINGGPSVFLATLFTSLLSVLSLFLFHKIVSSYFLKKNYAFWATVLLSVSFHFIDTSLSFNRDIPVLLTVLLFIYLFLKDANKWVIGISLLLMLDAKEHVFLTVAPLYALYIFLSEIREIGGRKILETLKQIFIKGFSGFSFSVIWVVLMFYTSVIPMNMFVASISGFIENGSEWNKDQFSVEFASENLMGETGKEIPRLSDKSILGSLVSCDPIVEEGKETKGLNVEYEENNSLCKIIGVGDIGMAYIGKILYPRTFSFISVPKIIVLPSLLYAVSLLLLWWKRKDRKYILPMILLFNVLVIIVRASHGRYLLSMAPIFMIFFVMFLRDAVKKPKYFRNILIATTAFVLLGLLFETGFLIPKIILETITLGILWAISLFRNNKQILKVLRILFLVVLVGGMFATYLAFSYKIGQISSYLKYGENRETEKMHEAVKDVDIIWIGDYGSEELITVYRKNLYNDPEWYWKLADSVPKKKLLKTYGVNNTLQFDILGFRSFKEAIVKNNVDKVVFIMSSFEDSSFLSKANLTKLLSADWLTYEEEVVLKNKVMYIFRVED